jgi:amidase
MPRPRAASPGARFKDDLTKWFAKHPGVPFGSVKAIADSKLVHPLHQALFDEAAAAKPVDEDPVTIEDLKNEKRYQEGLSGSDGHRAGRRADLPELDAASRH